MLWAQWVMVAVFVVQFALSMWKAGQSDKTGADAAAIVFGTFISQAIVLAMWACAGGFSKIIGWPV